MLAFLFFLVAWYFTAEDYPNLRRVAQETIPRSVRRIGVQARGAFSAAFGGYLKAEILVSLGVTGLLLVGFFLLRQPYWVLLAVALGILDFIPIVGAGTVMVPWSVILLVLGEWKRGVAFLAVWGVICLFRRMIEPKIVGDQTGLHPLLSLLATAVGSLASTLERFLRFSGFYLLSAAFEGTAAAATALMTEREKRRLLADYEGDGDPMFLTEALWDSTEGLDPVSRMQQVDINLWLAGDILLKADKMSMAHSLELRVPFLDREVWALAAALPAAAKADARTTKIALRQAAARTLPAASAARKKLGFPVPVRDWLRQEPYTSRVRAAFARPAAAQFFRPQVLHSMLNRHLHGGDCWRQIWCVYSFLIWYEQFFGA